MLPLPSRHMHMHVSVCEGQRAFLRCHLPFCFEFFFVDSLSLAWNSPGGLGWLASKTQDARISSSAALELQEQASTPGFCSCLFLDLSQLTLSKTVTSQVIWKEHKLQSQTNEAKSLAPPPTCCVTSLSSYLQSLPASTSWPAWCPIVMKFRLFYVPSWYQWLKWSRDLRAKLSVVWLPSVVFWDSFHLSQWHMPSEIQRHIELK